MGWSSRSAAPPTEQPRSLGDPAVPSGLVLQGRRAETHHREIPAKGIFEELTLRLEPITTLVRNHTASAATAEIFRRQLCSFPAKRALDDYATAEVNWYWEHGEWRLADSSVIDGPYPVARFSARPTLASTAARLR